jgi:hypothetical protein
MEIRDNDQVIGKIKDGETLSWDRSQGSMRLSVTPVFNTPFKDIAPLIIDVKQGHIYQIAIRGLKVPFGGRGSFMVTSSSVVAGIERIEGTGGKAADSERKPVSAKVSTIEPNKYRNESFTSNTKELAKIDDLVKSQRAKTGSKSLQVAVGATNRCNGPRMVSHSSLKNKIA